jgi:hypothetical protein
MKKLLFASACIMLTTLLSNPLQSYGQKQAKAACIGFYNLENLFDTIDDPKIDDAEYTPKGTAQWTWERYQLKLDHMAEVISQIGDEVIKGGPTMIGFSEVENRGVLEDLIKRDALKNSGYGIVHYDSPDYRGVDVGFIYKKKDFTVLSSAAVPFRMAGQPGFRTRDELVVTGLLDGDTLSVVVNHWPSRSHEAPYRIAAGLCDRRIVDSLYRRNKDARVLVMGDLNDDPIDESVHTALGAEGKESKVKTGGLFNPMWQLYKDGIGSLAYKDSWNLFDQIIVTEPLIRQNNSSWKLYKARIFKKPFMIQPDGQYAGYPFRTFAGGAYAGGYSDHLPAYVILVKEKK